jgi:hypothetical protein
MSLEILKKIRELTERNYKPNVMRLAMGTYSVFCYGS